MKTLPNRQTIRLKSHDYSSPGLYFITICVQDRAHLFGEVVQGIMQLNPAGQHQSDWYYRLPSKFPQVRCHQMIVMPNHIHFIVEIVGADPCVCPFADPCVCPFADPCVRPTKKPAASLDTGNPSGVPDTGNPVGLPLGNIIQWYKTMTTNQYIRGVKQGIFPRFRKRLWQRNYWEHIIRDQRAYDTISQYIINNPKKWEEDKFHP